MRDSELIALTAETVRQLKAAEIIDGLDHIEALGIACGRGLTKDAPGFSRWVYLLDAAGVLAQEAVRRKLVVPAELRDLVNEAKYWTEKGEAQIKREYESEYPVQLTR